MIKKSKVQQILKQFNTSITFDTIKTDNTRTSVKVYHIIDTYYLQYYPFQAMKTRLKDVVELLNDTMTTNIKIDTIEGYGAYNMDKLVLE